MFIASWVGSVVCRNVLRPLCYAAPLSALACGGPPDAQSPQSEPRANSDESTSRELEPPLSEGDPLEGGEERQPPAALAPLARCEGGQCFECGDNLCPEGFYCDANATCAWLPQCTGAQLTCACLTSKLTGCSCKDDSDHLTLSCAE